MKPSLRFTFAVVVLALAACAQANDSVPAGSESGPAVTSVTTPPVDAVAAGSRAADEGAEPAVTVAPEAETTATAEESDQWSPALGANEFGEYILPVLQNSCASCHNEGQAGSDHFLLETAADAVARADDLKLYTGTGVMPPWPPSALSLDFVGDHSLNAEQIARIAAWADVGAPLDVTPETRIVSSQPSSYLQDRDIVMTSSGGAYTGSTDTIDDYRCLVYEPGNDELEFILASHFEPDRTEIVHHAIVTLAAGVLRDQAAALDATDPGPGWTCYGGIGFSGTPGGYQARLGGWAPGAQPARLPEGYATPLTPGDFIIVQIHYHFDDAFADEPVPPDLSRFVLSLASDQEIEANAGWFKSLTGELYLGPAEIPCYAGDTEPLCDRSAALARVKDLYGDFIGALPNYFLQQCGAKVEDFAAMTDGTSRSTCDLPVRNPGRIVSVSGHMHELGLSIRLTLNPDTPEERILLDIPDWDFEWQLGYSPAEEIVVSTDDVIRVDCAWNRERAPYEAVGYILWADGTGDEMCYSNITTAPLD